MPATVVAVTAAGALGDVGRSLREAFYMFWDTLWALVLGFALSGAVQAFVSRSRMRRLLGSHGPASITRASLYGMASSSCSYAASAMARSLVAGGADFLAAMVFMFASTNLVIELGIVLLVLIGWQFVAAEFVGGVIMILLLVSFGALWLRGRAVVRAREQAGAEGSVASHEHDPPGEPYPAVGPPSSEDGEAAHTPPSPSPAAAARIRSVAGWSDAAAYTMSDLRMLRREMGVGFVVAGFLTVLVPAHVWSDLLVRGHGVWTSLENVLVAPFVAIISFVCSVGNVPLAAALWKGGTSFGGVVAFVFADLITFPLLLVYRRQYGLAMAARMLAVFWAVMSGAGLAVQYLFDALGWVPHAHPGVVVGDTLRWNYTTVLDIAALTLFGILYWLYRYRRRLGGGTAHARDPVCGMQVERAQAPATVGQGAERVYFCSPRCRDRFLRHRGRPATARQQGEAPATPGSVGEGGSAGEGVSAEEGEEPTTP